MEIPNDTFAKTVCANIVPCVGFVIGPIATITGLAWAIFHGLGMLSATRTKDEKAYKSCNNDAIDGAILMLIGLFCCIPGTFIVSYILYRIHQKKEQELRAKKTT